jgi:alpha-beta hydrolase superfamily lysophospholipase
MIRLIHLLLVTAYLTVPVIMLSRGIYLAVRRKRRVHLQRFWLTAFGGLLSAFAVCAVYAVAMHGRLIVSQLIITAYFATGLLLLLRGFDALLRWSLPRAMMLRRRPGPSWSYGLRAAIAMLLRTTVVFCIGLPYVLATVMTYRPKVAPSDNPQSLLHWQYEPVTFRATDGTRLSGWWIPAAGGESARTVVFCHGLSATKATQLSMTRRLVPGGYNVLAFDFRAHGESGGQQITFGDIERDDVLGAVRWLRENHPTACRRLVGLGTSTGGAALIAAAVDPGPEGQNIDAVAVCGTFDRLDLMVADTCRDFVPTPLKWLTLHLGLPLASAQVGVNLQAFAPADAVKLLWPRPILVIHGVDDEMVRFDRGQALFDAALQPKYYEWIDHAGHEEAIKRDDTAKLLKRYFDSAVSVL